MPACLDTSKKCKEYTRDCLDKSCFKLAHRRLIFKSSQTSRGSYLDLEVSFFVKNFEFYLVTSPFKVTTLGRNDILLSSLPNFFAALFVSNWFIK
jgi:hypothetical protein